MTTELYISTDIETNGPIPARNSMLSFASAAFLPLQPNEENKRDLLEPIATFSRNLEELPGSKPNTKTMIEFWDKKPEAWKACRSNLVEPNQAMTDYVAWLNGLRAQYKAKPIFVGYPATFDFQFVYWYIINAGLESPFGFSALDIKSYAMAVLKKPFSGTVKKEMPRHWFPKTKHTHIALDDAIEQGQLFMNILMENK